LFLLLGYELINIFFKRTVTYFLLLFIMATIKSIYFK